MLYLLRLCGFFAFVMYTIRSIHDRLYTIITEKDKKEKNFLSQYGNLFVLKQEKDL